LYPKPTPGQPQPRQLVVGLGLYRKPLGLPFQLTLQSFRTPEMTNSCLTWTLPWGVKKLTTSSFKRPSSPVKFTEKKSKNVDDFGDDDDEDLFNFDEPEPEVESSQRKRKRSDDDVIKEQQPSKKKNVKSPLPSPAAPISVVKEEIPKSVKVVKKTNGFLCKSLFSNTALSTATSVKSDIPAEDMTRSFIKLELRSLVAKKPNSSINISANSPQENLSNGNVKNVKRFRKQIIAQTNSPVLCITNVSARTILEHFDDAPAQASTRTPLAAGQSPSTTSTRRDASPRVSRIEKENDDIEDLWDFDGSSQQSMFNSRKRKR